MTCRSPINSMLPPVPASSVPQMARTTSNAPSTSSSTLTDSSHFSSSMTHSVHTRMPATADDEFSNPSEVGDEYEERFDRHQEERGYSNAREDHRNQHGGYNEQNEAHRERDIRNVGELGSTSPQYGIRDLPQRTHPSQPSQPPAQIQERQWTRARPTRSATLPTPPSQSPTDFQDSEPQSLTLRMAALGLSPSPQSPSHMQGDLSKHPSAQSSRSSSPSFDLGSHPLLQRVPSTKEQELENMPRRPPLQRGQSVVEGLQRHPFASAPPLQRRVSGRSRSLVREQEWRSMSPAREQSPVREPSPTRSQWPQNIPPLPRAPLSPAGSFPFSPGFNTSDVNTSPTRSAFARPASPLKNSVFPSSGFSRPTSPSKSPLPTPPPKSPFARAESVDASVFSSPRKTSGGKGPFGPQNQNSPSNSPQKSSNAYTSPTLPSSSSPPKLAYLSNSSARNAFPPSAFPSSSFPTSSTHTLASNSHIMERQRQKQRAYVKTYDLDDEPPASPLRERVGLPSPSASRSPSPSDFGARVGGRSVSRGRANKADPQDHGYGNEDDGDERSPSPIRFAKRSSNQFSVLEMDFVGGQEVPRWHRTPVPRVAGGRADGSEGRRTDMGVPVVTLPGGHVDFDDGGGGAVPSSRTQDSPPRIAVSSATPPRVAVSSATPPRVAVIGSTPPRVAVTGSTPPRIAVSGSSPPRIAVSGSSPSPPQISVSSPSMPQISVSLPSTPQISVSVPSCSSRQPSSRHTSAPSQEPKRVLPPPPGQNGLRGAGGQNNGFNVQGGGKISGVLKGMRGNGLSCGGCGGPIIGRIVSAMGQRWHPACFCCSACNELLEHVSSYEHEGKPYCHLDYHENFAPRCYHCKTAIIDERFITLDDDALGKRTYHEQHFFCAECGDPFLPPSSGSGGLTVTGDGEFDLDDDVGFTVYKGHPYCEACHVRLRMPKCKRCKKSIRDGMRAVEALGGKWCWECFVCEGCKNPFEDPSFFLRDNKPFCEPCFSLILRNEV
ncbi:uncharacterized protein EDB91DRAFT_409256 [Suillus paluster]|uniref:uncharacterized protein n=1 Tax=Suillus paluster TaxID=48578 RepID=UPI001B883916|nr:uncharacterized protein EDB91DRAFT_409256 [Suillus paluster]KAG1753633.1 hypothetical protein EDB91DRAFT_409256 [Suillus paluster]